MGLSWGYSLRVASLSFSHPLIHSVHCIILYANKFQAELLFISTDNSRGKTKQNLSVRTLSLRNFVCTPAVIHSALDCFLPTSSYLFCSQSLKMSFSVPFLQLQVLLISYQKAGFSSWQTGSTREGFPGCHLHSNTDRVQPKQGRQTKHLKHCWRRKELDKKPQPGCNEEVKLDNYQHLCFIFTMKAYTHTYNLTSLSVSCLNLKVSLYDAVCRDIWVTVDTSCFLAEHYPRNIRRACWFTCTSLVSELAWISLYYTAAYHCTHCDCLRSHYLCWNWGLLNNSLVQALTTQPMST